MVPRPRWLFALGLFACLFGMPRHAAAQGGEAGDELTISILTIEPGDEIFEKFAHNAIRVHDSANQTDLVYNYGVFDFDASKFYYRFLKGELDYWVDEGAAEDAFAWYKSLNRSIWEQELNLTPAQKVKLRDYLAWNVRPENRTYRYNYYMDNCSTRVRDAIDRVVDGQIKAQLDKKPTGTTWRWHTRRLTRESVLWYSALNTVMGPAIDRPISQWEESFLPIKFREHLRDVTVKTADGRDQPLIGPENTIFTSTRGPEPTAPPNWIVGHLLTGLLIGGLMALPAWGGKRISFGIAATTYATILGFAGCFGLWMWLCTSHWACSRNESLFGYSPIALLAAFFIPAALRKIRLAVSVARWAAILVAASTVLGILLKMFLPQVNGEAMALVLAPNIALAWAVWHITTTTHEQPTDLPPHPQRAS